jgi:hypothetical protein
LLSSEVSRDSPDMPVVLCALDLCSGDRGEGRPADALASALEAIGFDVDAGDSECVGITSYVGKLFKVEDVLIALAPFVAPDSIVEWRGEAGDRWRDVVRDGAIQGQRPNVEWVDDDSNPSAAPALVTVIPVQYRDGSNYQAPGRIELAGAITPTQIAALRAALDEGTHYVPRQLGLSHLGASKWSSFPGDDDHSWHEMELEDVEVLRADSPARLSFAGVVSDENGTVADFVRCVERVAAAGWDPGEPSEWR